MDQALIELLPCIVDNHDSGIIVLNENFKTIIVNNWIKKHCHLNKSDYINQNVLDLFPQIKNQRLHTVILDAIELNHTSILSQAIHQSPLPLYQESFINGKRKLMQQRITVVPIKIKSGAYCFLQVFDVSSAVVKEFLLKATATKAQISKEHAESLSKIKSEFISTVSHELRTPLTSISGSTGLILGGATGENNTETIKLLEIIHRNSERLLNLINDLLDIQKIESGTIQFNFDHKNLKSLISNCIEMNSAYANKFNINYDLVTENEDYNVYIDEKRINQVILNLLSNATKFSDKNSTVKIELIRDHNNIRTAVTDNGQGIPEHFKNRIFTKFAQANSEDNREYAGSGLGLCICRTIIEHHNGEINFYNNTKGATFYFDLPIENVPQSLNLLNKNLS